ncbi:MAG: hypothetical protein PF961_03065 [Planctomycetota bacterium]|nr:hypothetical protein [Planctomycetota bacterium]
MARWNRQQFMDLMQFRPIPRPFFAELFGPLKQLADEWSADGVPLDQIEMRAFGFDTVDRHFVPVHLGLLGGEEVVLEDTATHRITRDGYGRTMKLAKAAATIPLPLDHPVATMDDWLAIKPRYQWSDERLGTGWDGPYKPDYLVRLGFPGGFDEPRQLMGEENLCLAVAMQPELVHDMLDTMATTAETGLRRLAAAGVRLDYLFVHEDMAGKSGPLFGPRQINEFVGPYYQRVWAAAQECGAQIFGQDSDGDIRPVMDQMLAAGLNMMFPFEPAAGMDMVATRAQYGERLAIMGGIDKHALRHGRAAIDIELARKLVPELNRGTVFGLDHRIPNGVTIDNYRYYVRQARERLGLEADPEPCWGRMAF